MTVTALYGLTEALPVAAAAGEQVLASPEGRTSLGRPVPGVSVRIDDPDRDGVGEIVVSGPQARDRIAGEAPTREVHTGDLGSLEPDGTLLLAGRAKNMIIRGQANIYPDLVEPLLRERLADRLADCALVGVSDPVTGDERVVLAVAPAGPPARRRTRRSSAHDVARAVHAVWPTLADEAWRPDEVVLVATVPRRGRSRAVDVDALRAIVGATPEGDRA